MNRIKPLPLFTACLLATLLCNMTNGYAQSETCKAHVRANRGHTMTYSNFTLQEASFSNGHQFYVTSKGTYDSVYVESKWNFNTSFKAGSRGDTYGTNVSSPFIVYKYGDVLLVDSLHPNGRKGYLHNYFDMYQSDKVAVTYNPEERSRKYSSVNGKDSLFMVNNPKGTISKMVWYDRYGNDTATKLWNAAGIISNYNNRAGYRIYHFDGALQSLTSDTLIDDRLVSSQTIYYPNGNPKSIVYYCQSAPCHTWRYYNEQGILTHTVQKAAITSFPNTAYGVAEIRPDPIFTYVIQMPEYPGGIYKFKAYMNAQLADLLCKSAVKLQGTYQIRMQLNPDNGSITFLDAKGLNAAALTQGFAEICSGMPRWRPGKRNGRNIKHIFVVEAKVE